MAEPHPSIQATLVGAPPAEAGGWGSGVSLGPALPKTGHSALKILHVVAPGPVGGLERVVHALAAGHRANGHEVHVAAILDPGCEQHPLLGLLADAGVSAHPLVVPGRAYLEERRMLAALIARIGPQVLHSHGYRTDVMDAPVARRFGVPVVSTVHGFTRGGWKNRLYERLQRRSYRSLDAVVAVSRQQVPELLRSGTKADRLHVISNAFAGGGALLSREAARAQLNLPADATVIGWVGRLGREKGADILVDAMARLGDTAHLASIVGDGAERAALEARVVRLGLGERVRWHGIRRDAASLMPAFDLFVLSSRTEGTPIALFEAMYAGVPIVAARVGGVPDVVSEAEALLVEPESVAALAQAIRHALGELAPSLARARNARARLAHFAAGPWLASYERLYRSLLRSPAQPAGS